MLQTKAGQGLPKATSASPLHQHVAGRKFVFLINPIAGTGKKTVLQDLISATMAKHNLPFEIAPTDKNGDYSSLATRIVEEKITDVIVCGGDGTVNAVAANFRDIAVNIGIIPGGSGNGLAFAARIPRAPLRALHVILHGNSSYIDGFYINNRFSCMLCGIGFDAQVAHDFAKQKRRGLQTYIKVSALNYFKAKAYTFSLDCAGGRFREQAFFVCVANSNQFGNNFTIAPQASLTDGLLDIVIVKKMSKLMIPFSIIGQTTGINRLQRFSEQISKNKIIYFQASELTIGNPGLAPLHIDGDPVDTAAEFHIRLIKNAFRLLHP